MVVFTAHDATKLLLERPLALFISLIALSATSYIIYFRYLHPLAKYPGPLICSLTNFYKFWATWTDQIPEQMLLLHQTYGDVVRIGPNDLSFNQPQALEDIYKRGWQKGTFYLGFDQRNPGLFSERDELRHAKRKRMFGSNFSLSAIKGYEEIIDSRYAILRRQLDRFAERGEVFDLRKYITYTIVDILGDLAFSNPFGNQSDEDPKKIPRVSEALWASCVAGCVPWLAPGLEWLRGHLPRSAEMVELLEGRNVIVRLASEGIKKRSQNPGGGRDDILGKIVAASEGAVGGEKLSHGQILAEAITLVVGGTHTTGNTLHILFANLGRDGESMRRCVREVDERLPQLRSDQACYGISGLEEKLDFVNACIRETHRNNPVGTFNMPRTVPEGGRMIAGLEIPGGTQASMNIHAFHHNEAIWGSDHDVFDPTRWYDDRAKGLSHLVVPFSVGKRACVGQNLAIANILKMTTTLLRCYDFEFVNKDEPIKVVSHGDSDLRTPILVKVKMRDQAYNGPVPPK